MRDVTRVGLSLLLLLAACAPSTGSPAASRPDAAAPSTAPVTAPGPAPVTAPGPAPVTAPGPAPGPRPAKAPVKCPAVACKLPICIGGTSVDERGCQTCRCITGRDASDITAR